METNYLSYAEAVTLHLMFMRSCWSSGFYSSIKIERTPLQVISRLTERQANRIKTREDKTFHQQG